MHASTNYAAFVLPPRETEAKLMRIALARPRYRPGKADPVRQRLEAHVKRLPISRYLLALFTGRPDAAREFATELVRAVSPATVVLPLPIAACRETAAESVANQAEVDTLAILAGGGKPELSVVRAGLTAVRAHKEALADLERAYEALERECLDLMGAR